MLRKVQEGKTNHSSSCHFRSSKGMVWEKEVFASGRIQTHHRGTTWGQFKHVMVDVRDTANVIRDSSRTSGQKLVYSKVCS